jgi:hypothetical protein
MPMAGLKEGSRIETGRLEDFRISGLNTLPQILKSSNPQILKSSNPQILKFTVGLP